MPKRVLRWSTVSFENFGRYEILGELGRGGMAAVFRAYDPRFKRDVAVKVLPPELMYSPDFRARFEREAQTIAALEHPAIVPVYDFGEQDGQLYLVMRFMTGGSLSDRLQAGPFSIDKVVPVLQRIGSALDHAHKQGIVHRDLKPGNILFDQFEDAYLADFGIVHLPESPVALTITGAVMGTPAYMSPEQIHGDKALDGRSDIYSLGIILFEMLTGHQPYEADTPAQVMMKHIMNPVPDIRQLKPDLPAGTGSVIAQALTKERDQRYPTAAALVTSVSLLAAARPSMPGIASQPFAVTSKPNIEPPSAQTGKPGTFTNDLPTTSPHPRRKLPTWVWITIIVAALALPLLWRSGLFSVGRVATPPIEPTSLADVASVQITESAAIAAQEPTALAALDQPTSTLPPTDKPTSTPLPTPSVTPLPTALPTFTPTRQLVRAYKALSLESVANAAFDFSEPPLGDVTLGGIPFSISEQLFKSQASPVPHNASPTSVLVEIDVSQAYRVHILLNTGNGFLRYDGMVIGRIFAHCNDTATLVTDLQLGRDVREWHPADNVVSAASRVDQVWQGNIAGYPNLTGYIDMLSLDLPLACQDGRLSAVEIVDTSVETVNSLDPALNVIAITVEFYQ